MFAASTGNVGTVELLLTKGKANVEITNSYRETALDIAEKHHHKNIVEILQNWKYYKIPPQLLAADTLLPQPAMRDAAARIQAAAELLSTVYPAEIVRETLEDLAARAARENCCCVDSI